ncbi:MAG: transp aux protein, partial [Acidobacteria bacterium]|nr:transp aux protein [Acidobacteriota bacterium]
MALDVKGALGSRQAKYGLNTLIYCLVAVAIVVVVNLIANRFVRQIDLTANQRYSLSPQTTKILSELQNDVEFLYFDRRAGFANVEDRLAMYPTSSRRVKVTFVDPDREPSKATQYNIRSYGTLVIAAAGRNEQAKAITEEDITNTIIRVIKGGPKKIYFLTGHGERDIASEERLGYSAAKKLLEDSNYTVETLSLLQETPKIPDDATALIVAGPQNDLLDPEVAAIKDFLVKGGRAFFLVHPMTPPKLTALLAEFGADTKNTLVVDTSGIGRLFGTDELMPLVVQYDNHPITRDMTNIATLFPFSAAVQTSTSGMPGATFQPIARTTDKSWATPEVRSREVSFREGRDIQGPLPLLGAGTFKPPETADSTTEGRY